MMIKTRTFYIDKLKVDYLILYFMKNHYLLHLKKYIA